MYKRKILVCRVVMIVGCFLVSLIPSSSCLAAFSDGVMPADEGRGDNLPSNIIIPANEGNGDNLPSNIIIPANEGNGDNLPSSVCILRSLS